MAGNSPESSKPQAVPSSARDAGRNSPPESLIARSESIARLGSPVPSSIPTGTPVVRQIPTQGRADAPSSSLPGLAESALSSALKESFGKSPPRFATPPLRPLSPSTTEPSIRAPPSHYGSFDGRGRSPVPYEDPEIVRRHLVGHYASPSRSNRGFIGDDDAQSQSRGGEDEDAEFSSLQCREETSHGRSTDGASSNSSRKSRAGCSAARASTSRGLAQTSMF
jgi:proton-coupled amino acid transporter